MARIEELEKENKRLAKEAAESEKRWQKAEDELADIREDDGDDHVKTGGPEDGLCDSLVRGSLCASQHQSASSLTHVTEDPACRFAASELAASATSIAGLWPRASAIHVPVYASC